MQTGIMLRPLSLKIIVIINKPLNSKCSARTGTHRGWECHTTQLPSAALESKAQARHNTRTCSQVFLPREMKPSQTKTNCRQVLRTVLFVITSCPKTSDSLRLCLGQSGRIPTEEELPSVAEKTASSFAAASKTQSAECESSGSADRIPGNPVCTSRTCKYCAISGEDILQKVKPGVEADCRGRAGHCCVLREVRRTGIYDKNLWRYAAKGVNLLCKLQ